MSLKERTYSILVVSSTDSFASAFIGSLPVNPVLSCSYGFKCQRSETNVKRKVFRFCHYQFSSV